MLQVNLKGSWKHVVPFPPARRVEVLGAVKRLAGILGPNVTWCLLHADGKREWIRIGNTEVGK